MTGFKVQIARHGLSIYTTHALAKSDVDRAYKGLSVDVGFSHLVTHLEPLVIRVLWFYYYLLLRVHCTVVSFFGHLCRFKS